MHPSSNSTDCETGFLARTGDNGFLGQKMDAWDRAMPKTKLKTSVKVERETGFLLEAPEVSIFLACLASINELRFLASGYESGELTRSDFSRESSLVVGELNELASATERFDIVSPVMEFGQFSPFFWRWFNWWHDYLQDLTPRQVTYLEKLARQGAPSLEVHRPKNDWVRYRHTPAFALVIA